MGILLAVMMVLVLACMAATADEVPQPEGGKKFEGNWAVQNMLLTIVYEEEGYRVCIETKNYEVMNGTRWEYNCHYVEEKDALVSMHSSKASFFFDEDNPDLPLFNAPEYEDLDVDNNETVFSFDDHGHIIWTDGRGNDGADLEFINIGDFGGSWKNDAEQVYVEITWNGEDDAFFYNVWMQRGESNADTYVIFDMTGVYNNETGKLECTGTAVTHTKNADGEYAESEDGEIYEAFFSMAEDGKLLFETANGIELEYYESNS